MAIRAGFTIVELGILLVVCVLIVGILLPAVGHTHHCGSRQIRDGTQVRGVHQGMVLFAQNNKDQYPLPSVLDVESNTVAGPAEAKDTTGNIFSILLFQNFFTPELCVSPSETNPAIRIDSRYEFNVPTMAVNPVKALWDPGFNADFTLAKPSRVAGVSYAHQMPFGARREKMWNNSFNSHDAMVANRGPKVSAVTQGKNPDVAVAFDTKSITLQIHGRPTTWEGNVAYNDNSIQFETSLAPENKVWSEKPEGDTSKKTFGSWRDCLFFDEAQDPNRTNNYLVNVSKVGDRGPELIWD